MQPINEANYFILATKNLSYILIYCTIELKHTLLSIDDPFLFQIFYLVIQVMFLITYAHVR